MQCASNRQPGEVHRDPHLFGVIATLKDESKRAEVDAAILAAVKDVSAGNLVAAAGSVVPVLRRERLQLVRRRIANAFNLHTFDRHELHGHVPKERPMRRGGKRPRLP